MEWRERFESEIQKAERARGRGNEGQARVCARRAAGIAAVEYLRRRGQVPTSRSSIDALRHLQNLSALPPDLALVLDHLLQKVDTEFKLPDGVDLIEQAGRLSERLLPR
jgi:hypothetical protein